MPVTAKLSKNFYDRLGEPIANELVDWFNAVDQTYRTELRELNEVNFARVDAKLEQRLAETRAALEVAMARGFSETDAKFAQLHTNFAQFDTKFAQFDTKFAQLEAKLERRLGEQTRWMFVFWATQILTIVGLLARR